MTSQKNINRFIHTYIQLLLNRLLEIVEENDKDKVIQLIQNNNYQSVQMGRIVQDSYPEFDFSVYRNLELLRTFKEKFLNNTVLADSEYDNLEGKQLSPNTLGFKYRGQYSNSNIDYPYEFEAELNPNYPTPDNSLTLSEKDLLTYLRNADAHGDIEIIISSKSIDGFKAETYIKFGDNRSRFSEIRMTADSLFQLLEKCYKRIYSNINPKELSIKRKNSVEKIEDNIKTAEDLREFLSNYCILVMDPEKVDVSGNEYRPFKIRKEKIIADKKEKFFLKCNIQNLSEKKIHEYERYIESYEFSEQDILDFEEYAKKNTSFYTKSIWEQYNIINEFYRRKYLSPLDYEIDKIIDYISCNAFDGKDLQNKLGLGLKERYRLPTEEIQEIFSLLTKAVFLTNKQSIFDIDPSIYEVIDISNFNILNINQSSLPYKINVFNHIRNSFTHYRYYNNSESETDLNSSIHLYDCKKNRKTGQVIESFSADTNLLSCFNIVLHSAFLYELNSEFINGQDSTLNLNNEEKNLYIAKELLKNPRLFMNLSNDFRTNPQIAEIATLLYDKNIKYIGEELKSREFILKMVKEVPSIYRELGMFYDDEEILNVAIHKDGYLLLDADRKFWTRDNFLIALEHTNPKACPVAIIGNMPEEYIRDTNYIKSMIKANPAIIHYIIGFNAENYDNSLREEIFSDIEIARCVAKKNREYLQYFDDNIRDNPDIVEEVKLFEKELFSRNWGESDEAKEIQRRRKKVYDIIRGLRNSADKASNRETIQSDIEEKLNLDRLNKSHTDFSSCMLGELRKQGEDVGLTDINNVKYKILRVRDETNNTINVQIKLEEGDAGDGR